MASDTDRGVSKGTAGDRGRAAAPGNNKLILLRVKVKKNEMMSVYPFFDAILVSVNKAHIRGKQKSAL